MATLQKKLTYGYLSIIQKNCIFVARIKTQQKDFKAYNVKYGELLIFDSRLHHGTEVNKEKSTRLSMDFRVIKKKLQDKKTTSPKLKIKFNVGGYFSED